MRTSSPLSLLVCLISGLLASCGKAPETAPRYEATEGILEVVSVLRLHIEDDTYRFPPARDFTGKNVYRASLNRLESLEEAYAQKLASGYLLDVVLFAKGRALERIREYHLAARHYQRVSVMESALVGPASIGDEICSRLLAASTLAPGAESTAEEALRVFDERRAALEGLLAEVAETHYVFVVMEELERADAARASDFAVRARANPLLDQLALDQFRALVAKPSEQPQSLPPSTRSRGLLRGPLASIRSRGHAGISAVRSRDLRRVRLQHTRLYETVSQQDGAVEKVEATRKLEAFLAFQLQVHDEKLQH